MVEKNSNWYQLNIHFVMFFFYFMLFWSLFQPFLGSFGMLGCLLNFWVVFKLRKGASITHFVGQSVGRSQKIS